MEIFFMKNFVMALVLLVGGSAFASVGDVVCKGNSNYGTSPDITLELASLGKDIGQVEEGVSVPYRLIIKKASALWLDVKVLASAEDVMFGFKSRSSQYGNIEGMIYMDEADQAWVNINGTKFNFDCTNE
jgi:hypothetical protein